MSKQTINIGTAANAKNGDSLRAAFNKVNQNFTELYTALGLDSDGLNLGAFEFSGSTISTTDSSSIVIDQSTTITSNLTVGGDILPSAANGGNLGSSAYPWRSLYVSNSTIYLGGTAIGIDQTGKLTVGGSGITAGSVAWNDVTGKPTIVSTANNGDLNADIYRYATLNVTSTQSMNILTPDGYIDITAAGGELSLLGRDRVEIRAGSSLWTFATNGSLTFPDGSQTLSTNVLQNGLDADVKGSVFGDDSSVMVNAVDNSLHASNIYINGNGYIRGSADQNINIQTSYNTSVPGQTITADDTQGGITNNFIIVLISGGGTNYPGIVAVQPGWTVTGTGLTNDPVTQVEQIDFGSGIVIYKIYTTTSSAKQGYTYNFTAPSTTVNTTKTWTFSDRGDLTIPGDIRSESNINIEINLADSTKHTWQFGEDGELILPNNGTIKINDGNLSILSSSYIFLDTLGGGQIDIGRYSPAPANVGIGSKGNGVYVVINGDLKIATGVYEKFTALTDATGVVTHNCANGHTFRHTSPDSNWTANFTNLDLNILWTTSVTLVIDQGVTGYYPNALQLDGVSQTINWQGNTTPTPSTNRTDVVTFSIFCTGNNTYTVLGQLTGF